MLCYLADISSMCRLASWQAETTGALGMLSLQEIWLILINTAANPLSASCNSSAGQLYFSFSSCHMRFCCLFHLFVLLFFVCLSLLGCWTSSMFHIFDSVSYGEFFFSHLNSLKPSPTAPPLHPLRPRLCSHPPRHCRNLIC